VIYPITRKHKFRLEETNRSWHVCFKFRSTLFPSKRKIQNTIY